MYINSLEQMEKFVEKNKNLFWSGWDVFNKIKTDKGRTAKNGAIINGNWYIINKIKLDRQGWYIPEKLR